MVCRSVVFGLLRCESPYITPDMLEGTFLIDGRKGRVPVLKNAIQSSLNMVDSVSIGILLSLKNGAKVQDDIRQLIVVPGIAVDSVKRVDER